MTSVLPAELGFLPRFVPPSTSTPSAVAPLPPVSLQYGGTGASVSGSTSALPRRRGRSLVADGYLLFTDNTAEGSLAPMTGANQKISVSSKYYDAFVFPRPSTSTYYVSQVSFYIAGTSNFNFVIELRGMASNAAGSLPGTTLAAVTCAVNATKTITWQDCPMQLDGFPAPNITSTAEWPYYAVVMYTNNAASADLAYCTTTGTAPTGVVTGMLAGCSSFTLTPTPRAHRYTTSHGVQWRRCTRGKTMRGTA